MVEPLIWLGSNHTKTRGRGSCGARHHSQRAASPKAERGRALVTGSSRRALAGSLKEKTLNSVWATRQAYFKTCTTLTMTIRGPKTSPTPSRRWPLSMLASWALMSMRSRRHGLAERTSRSLTTWQKVPQRTSISSEWCLPLNHPRSWA